MRSRALEADTRLIAASHHAEGSRPHKLKPTDSLSKICRKNGVDDNEAVEKSWRGSICIIIDQVGGRHVHPLFGLSR